MKKVNMMKCLRRTTMTIGRTVSIATIKNRFFYLNSGITFKGAYGSVVFKLFGYYWITNKKRKTMYSMDDMVWHPIKLSLLSKIKMIVTKQVKGIKDESNTVTQ